VGGGNLLKVWQCKQLSPCVLHTEFFVQYSSSSMSPRQRRGHTSNSTMQLTQTNWDAIPPAGQHDMLGVVGLVFTPVFFVQYSSSSKSPRQRRGHTSNSQANWDVIPPAGQDDILGVVIFAIHNKCIYTRNSPSSILRPACHLDKGEVTQATPQCNSHKPIGMRSFPLVRMTYWAW
jgi:hypothetical protein